MNGIYRINFPNGDSYIGRSFNIEKRIVKHRNNLKCERHINYKIQERYNIHKDFTWEVLEVVNGDKTAQGKREMYWIELLNPNLNLTKGGSSGWEEMVEKRKLNLTEDVLKKRGKAISESRKKLYDDPEKKKILIEKCKLFLNNGYKNQKTGSDSPIAKKIINTDTGEVYGSVKEVAKMLNINYTSFINRIKRGSKTLPYRYL